MPDTAVTQAEAEALIKMQKVPTDDNRRWDYPPLGGSLSIPLASVDKREEFFLDISRGQIDLTRGKYQNRARVIIVLVRLDFGGPPHRNPDGEEVPSPHLHLYREGYGDKWAYSVPVSEFGDVSDLRQTLINFMHYCNIIDFPDIQFGLFT
jgi:uncharacterized protein DUF6978